MIPLGLRCTISLFSTPSHLLGNPPAVPFRLCTSARGGSTHIPLDVTLMYLLNTYYTYLSFPNSPHYLLFSFPSVTVGFFSCLVSIFKAVHAWKGVLNEHWLGKGGKPNMAGQTSEGAQEYDAVLYTYEVDAAS
ncbi:hypothetical protein GGR52DRAFT_282109 [Hypoxylon sp. FL1284]|nr:hypothetical protein GGR52DRAFT_282109 [Hypoxylon sp. FL1284]